MICSVSWAGTAESVGIAMLLDCYAGLILVL